MIISINIKEKDLQLFIYHDCKLVLNINKYLYFVEIFTNNLLLVISKPLYQFQKNKSFSYRCEK
jgi:hypothetical protein